MANPESQRVVDLIHRLAGSDKLIEQCVPKPLRPQGLEVKSRTGKRAADHDTVIEKVVRRKPLSAPEVVYAQSILLPALRPAIEVANDSYGHVVHPAWSILDKPAVRQTLEAAIRATCRVENAGVEIGTGFLVAPDLVMTNRHVAAAFVVGVGSAPNFVWLSPAAANPCVNFRRETSRPDTEESATFEIAGPVMMHPYFDIALLKTKRPVAGVAPLRLSTDPNGAAQRAGIALVGYPAHDPDEDDPPASVITAPFGVKRVQPGQAGATGTVRSYDKPVASRGHDSSTLNGSSGSPVVDLTSGSVVGVHFYGRLRNSNWAVRTSDLACDPRVADAGVTFDAAAATSAGPWDDWWTLANRNALAAGSFNGTESVRGKRANTVTVTIPLTLKLDLKNGKAVAKGSARI